MSDNSTVEHNSVDENLVAGQVKNYPSQEQIDAIIRKRVYAAIGMGFVPIPLIDLAGLTAIQIEMLKALCDAYGIPFKEQWIKSAISGLCGGGLTVLAVPLVRSLAKAIPVIGYTAGVASVSITGAATTYALGCAFNKHFRDGGSLENFNVENSKTYFKEKIEEGKGYVSKLRKKENEQDSEIIVENVDIPSAESNNIAANTSSADASANVVNEPRATANNPNKSDTSKNVK